MTCERRTLARLAHVLLVASAVGVAACAPARRDAVPAGASVAVVRMALPSFQGPEVWDIDNEREAGWEALGPVEAAIPNPLHRDVPSRWYLARLQPGRYYLPLEARRGVMFSVPATPSRIYIGSFGRDCGGRPSTSICPIAQRPADETALAADVLARWGSIGPAVTRLAQPFPPDLGSLGLAPPQRVAITIDCRRWFKALQARDDGSRPTDNSSGCIGSVFGTIGRAGGTVGTIGGLALGGGGGGPSPALARAAAEREQQIEEEAQSCLRGRPGALEARSATQSLRAAFDSPAVRSTRASGPGTATRWEAAVTTASLHLCGPESLGATVAIHWRARRGEDVLFEAFTRQMATGLRRPWERAPPQPAPCRSIRDLCAPGGAETILQDVIASIASQRDVLDQGR